MSLVVKKQQGRWALEGQLTAGTIADHWEVLNQDRPKEGSWFLDFKGVTHIASPGLAFLLDCLRYGAVQSVSVHFSALPESVGQLIKVQGLEPLLQPHIQ